MRGKQRTGKPSIRRIGKVAVSMDLDWRRLDQLMDEVAQGRGCEIRCALARKVSLLSAQLASHNYGATPADRKKFCATVAKRAEELRSLLFGTNEDDRTWNKCPEGVFDIEWARERVGVQLSLSHFEDQLAAVKEAATFAVDAVPRRRIRKSDRQVALAKAVLVLLDRRKELAHGNANLRADERVHSIDAQILKAAHEFLHCPLGWDAVEKLLSEARQELAQENGRVTPPLVSTESIR